MKPKSLPDTIVEYIKSSPAGVSSLELAETFLKFKGPMASLAHKAVFATLAKDLRCTYGEDQLWHATDAEVDTDSTHLHDTPWAIVYVLISSDQTGRKPLHVSVLSPHAAQPIILEAWMVDPLSLSFEERSVLVGSDQESFNGRETVAMELESALEGMTAIFISYNQQRTLMRFCMEHGVYLTDDTLLLSNLLRPLALQAQKPATLQNYYQLLFSTAPRLSSIRSYGESFLRCFNHIVSLLVDKNITVRSDLNEKMFNSEQQKLWRQARFSIEDIKKLPQAPGIYGFKNSCGEHIYIGKAKNLRRRLMNYFRIHDESIKKMEQLREHASELITHICGSELECLVYEYRLIQKYSPSLNAQTNINERDGAYKSLQDCIVILPHVEKEKAMTFWFREDQKLQLIPLDKSSIDRDSLVEKIQSFFYSEKLPISKSDFAEQEISFRWINRHRDALIIIQVHQFGTAKEISGALEYSIKNELS